MATTLEMLLAALSNGGLPPVPDPAKPMPLGVVAPPNLGMPVTPAQDVPEAPLDQSIIQRYMGAAGPAPTPPRPASTLDRIVAAIGGFGAGVQGQGAQYIESLRAPQRQYERNLQDYSDMQSNLRLRGIDAAERDQDRRTAAAQRIEDQRYAREFERETRRLNLADDEQKERLRQSYQLERDARADRRALEQELQRERRQREDDARGIAGRLGTGPGAAPPAIAKELGAYYANITQSLSPAAAKWQNAQAKRAEMLASRGGTGGGSSSAVEDTLAEFETLKTMAIQAVKAARGTPRDEIEAVRRATAGVVRKMARQPRLFEVGTGQFGFPYAKPRATAPAPAVRGASPEGFPLALGTPGGPQTGPSDEEVKAYAKRFKLSPTKARQELADQ